MIDRPDQVERLMERLGAALPIPARPTPELQTTLQKQNGNPLPTDCRVTWVSYAGDEGDAHNTEPKPFRWTENR